MEKRFAGVSRGAKGVWNSGRWHVTWQGDHFCTFHRGQVDVDLNERGSGAEPAQARSFGCFSTGLWIWMPTDAQTRRNRERDQRVWNYGTNIKVKNSNGIQGSKSSGIQTFHGMWRPVVLHRWTIKIPLLLKLIKKKNPDIQKKKNLRVKKI